MKPTLVLHHTLTFMRSLFERYYLQKKVVISQVLNKADLQKLPITGIKSSWTIYFKLNKRSNFLLTIFIAMKRFSNPFKFHIRYTLLASLNQILKADSTIQESLLLTFLAKDLGEEGNRRNKSLSVCSHTPLGVTFQPFHTYFFSLNSEKNPYLCM